MHQEIVELRQYTLHPGSRDTLVELFDREFIEPQEHAGMSIIGQFRVLDEPDRFFWLRGFPDMETRAARLTTFYGGPVWKAHRDAANATMIDSDDVLLLQPACADSGFPSNGPTGNLYVANVYHFSHCVEGEFVREFERTLAPLIARAGSAVLASFVTEHRPNDFPALPVREGDHAFAWFAVFANAQAYECYLRDLRKDEAWQKAFDALRDQPRVIETKRLTPTTRSRLH